MIDQSYFDTVIKALGENYKDFERRYKIDLSNLEATQRTIVERIAGTRSLVQLNHQDILQNREEILKNRTSIDRNFEAIKSVEQKIDLIVEKLDKVLEKQ